MACASSVASSTTSTVRGQDARHGGPTDPERERDPEGSVPSTWDVGGRGHRDRSGPDPSPHVDGVAESSSEAKAKAVGEEKDHNSDSQDNIRFRWVGLVSQKWA